MISAIVWDFDGVIVDSEPLHYRAFLAAAASFGYTFDWDEYLEQFVGYDDRDAFRVMLGRSPGPSADEDSDQLTKLCADKAKAFEQVVNEGFDTIPGAIELIEQASSGDMVQAIASGATRQDIEIILQQLGLTSRFATIVSADDVARSKPDPQTYVLAVERLGLSPAQCVSIEDTPAGVQSARDAGLHAIALTTTTTADALHRAHRHVDTLEGVTVNQLHTWFDD